MTLSRPRLAALLAAAAAAVTGVLGAFPARSAAAPVAIGAFVPDFYKRPSLIDAYAKDVGRRPLILLSFKEWTIPPFDSSELNSIASRGAVPMVTWEPWDTSINGASLRSGRGYSLRSLARGSHDRYIRDAARSAAAWGGPILVRFAHEMNGHWYPWGDGVRGNTPAAYVAAWRHLVSIFRQEGADNVEWVWSVNIESDGRFPFEHLYPGGRWVDWVGMSGFNWGQFGWHSFTELFGQTYEDLSELTGKPIIVTETGSGEEDGDKAAWVRSALMRELPLFPNIRGLIWFNAADPQGDARVDSSEEALAALREAIRQPRYRSSRALLLSTPEAVPRQVEAPPVPAGDYGEPSLLERIKRELDGREAWLGAALAAMLVLGTAAGLAYRGRRRRRHAPAR